MPHNHPSPTVITIRPWYHWQRTPSHLLLIVILGIAVYANSFSVPFYFDDYCCIANNPVVHDITNILHLDEHQELGISEDIRNNVITRLVAYASFALNYRLHGVEPAGYHLVNLLIHLATGLLVYRLARIIFRLRLPMAGRGDTQRADILACLVAILFVVHPVHTNAVTYITQRFASLATLFCLASLLAHIASVQAATQRRRRLWTAASLSTAVLAMFTKEIAFTLPVIVTLYDLIFLPGTTRQRCRRLLPLAATLIVIPTAVIALTAYSERLDGNILRSLDLVNFNRISRWDYFTTQWRVLLTYLRLLVWPANLNLDYDYPLYTSLLTGPVAASGIVLLALLTLGIALLQLPRWRPERFASHWQPVGFGILWFFISISVVASVIPLEDVILEYRLYLPSIGLMLAAVAGGDALCRSLSAQHPGVNRAALVLALTLVASLATATVLRNAVWQDKTVFWEDVVKKSPAKARPRGNLAASYFHAGRYLDCAEQLRIGAALPGLAKADHLQFAMLNEAIGRDDIALVHLRQVLALGRRPQPKIRAAIVRTYLRLNRTAEARDELERLRSERPDHPETLVLLDEVERSVTPIWGEGVRGS